MDTGAVRILVVGASGMLGHALVSEAERDTGVAITAAVRQPAYLDLYRRRGIACVPLDVSDDDSVQRVISRGFDTVINCAAITRPAEDDEVQAIRLNALAPHVLARACTASGARLIQISTDGVFSGVRGGYSEDDRPDATDLYGLSKLLGEVTYAGHLTVRTSFIGWELGPPRHLLEWFTAQRDVVRGHARVYWSGATTPVLGRVLLSLARRTDVSGLLHVGGERVSKAALMDSIRERFGIVDTRIEREYGPEVDRSLDCTRFRGLGLSVPTLMEMLDELVACRRGQRPELPKFVKASS